MRKFLPATALLFCTFIISSFQQLSAQAPTITSFTPATGPVGTLVTINGTNLSNSSAITIGGVNAIPISNTSTKLVVMVMPGAASGKVSVGSATAIGNFSITASKPPTKQQGNKLVGNNSGGRDFQGFSTAISADGNTAVVGSIADSGYLGAAFIFVRNNGTWKQQGAKLVGSNSDFTSQQGCSVAISADGNTVIVGGDADNYGLGAAWVFTREDTVWTQQGDKLVGTGSTGSNDVSEGASVALSADGNTAIISGSGDNNDAGAIWIFVRNNGTWTQQGAKLTGTGASTGAVVQGLFVALSADGNTAIEGGPGDSKLTGAAWIFVRKGDSWVQQGDKLVGTESATNTSLDTLARQGSTVSISADGNTAAIGGASDSAQGAVWIFVRNTDGGWSQQNNKLVGTGAVGGAGQGSCVSISADGNTIIESGYYDNNFQGAVWKFIRDTNGYWSQSGNKLTGSGSVTFRNITPAFGVSIAISADGNTIIAGGDADNNLIGAAWIFADSSATSLPVSLTNFTGYPQGKGVQTAWSGYNEINMASYDIERSANGYHFNKIGNVTAKDNNATENNYTWFDASPLKGDNYYRIKAISKDGTVQYSRIAKVIIGSALSSIQVYPNPVSNKTIQVQLNNVDAGTYAITVYNEAGQKVYSGSYVHAGGYATVPVLINGIAVGIYHVEVKGVGKALSTKVVVQ